MPESQDAAITADLIFDNRMLTQERDALQELLSDLCYNGSDRGYARGSARWAEDVRVSAERLGLPDADVAVLIG